ncbi:MAG TPA: hypothetical protein VFW64_23120 [Pseudonocardiaceae bacterium]|nr:hypothetical protein [Pseudonocardiaceae bacterium]
MSGRTRNGAEVIEWVTDIRDAAAVQALAAAANAMSAQQVGLMVRDAIIQIRFWSCSEHVLTCR